MAKLMEKPYPGEWEQKADETDSEFLKREDKMIKELDFNRIITFAVADGSAYYYVKVETPLVLQHIPIGDAYKISPSHMRGIRLDDVKRQLELNKIFQDNKGEKTMEKAGVTNVKTTKEAVKKAGSAMATMNKDAREAILTNRLTAKVLQAKGEVCKYDCNIGVIIFGRAVDGKSYFWVEGDEWTYEVKGNRFFNVSGGEIRKPFTGKAGKIGKSENTEGKAKGKGKEGGTVVIPKGGEMRTQLGYDGKEEQVPAVLYVNKIKCACGNIRWVKNADVFQVTKCKPCMRKNRLKKINELKKSKTTFGTKNGIPVKA